MTCYPNRRPLKTPTCSKVPSVGAQGRTDSLISQLVSYLHQPPHVWQSQDADCHKYRSSHIALDCRFEPQNPCSRSIAARPTRQDWPTASTIQRGTRNPNGCSAIKLVPCSFFTHPALRPCQHITRSAPGDLGSLISDHSRPGYSLSTTGLTADA